MQQSWTRSIRMACRIACIAWVIAGAAVGEAAVERVILISIDGLRNSEGFGDPDCQGLGDVTQCLLTNLARDLLPLGTLYTGEPGTQGSAFLNNTAPWTTPGHTMLLTGVRDIEPNTGQGKDLHPPRPTLFERLRKALGWDMDEVVAVVSKYNLQHLDTSVDPSHGPAYAPRLYVVPQHQAGAQEDIQVATAGRCLLRGVLPTADSLGCTATPVSKPRVLFLHFGGVDWQGHQDDGPLDVYPAAIQQVDGEIFTKIWGELCDQADVATCQAQGKNPDFRRNNTVLLITTDHGRESFTVTTHGGLDWANRAIFLLGVGPGIPAGQVFTNQPNVIPGSLGCWRRADHALFPCRQQEDLAPTLASLVVPSVALPDAEGVGMGELLGAAPGAFPLQRSEARVMAEQGSLHVVWSERDPSTGERAIWYQRLNPSGQTSFPVIPDLSQVEAPRQLSLPTDAETRRLTAQQPYLFVTGPRARVVYTASRSVQEGGDNLADLYLVTSGDGGSSWNPPERVAASVVETVTSPEPVVYLAPATVLEVQLQPLVRRLWVFTTQRPGAVVGFYRDGGGPWSTPPATLVAQNVVCGTLAALEDEDAGLDCTSAGYYAQRPDATLQGQRVELVWQAVGRPD